MSSSLSRQCEWDRLAKEAEEEEESETNGVDKLFQVFFG